MCLINAGVSTFSEKYRQDLQGKKIGDCNLCITFNTQTTELVVLSIINFKNTNIKNLRWVYSYEKYSILKISNIVIFLKKQYNSDSLKLLVSHNLLN